MVHRPLYPLASAGRFTDFSRSLNHKKKLRNNLVTLILRKSSPTSSNQFMNHL